MQDMVPEPRIITPYKVKYPIGYDFESLLNDLDLLFNAAFGGVAVTENMRALQSQSWLFIEAMDKALSHAPTAYFRRKELQSALDLAVLVLNEIMENNTAVSKAPLGSFPRDAEKALTVVTKRLKKAGRPVSNSKAQAYYSNVETHDPEYLTIDLITLNLTLVNVLRGTAPDTDKKTQTQTQAKNKDEQASTAEALNAVSEELGAAYLTVLDMADEAGKLDNLAAEDQYFIEQTHADYLPQIVTAVGKLTYRTSFQNKEEVVTEALKQLRILQAGLHNIVKSAAFSMISGMRAQTDFLARKVIGDTALTLAPDESARKAEELAEEAARIREDLYQKHVAPVLEANKAEYEASLQQERARLTDAFKEEQAGLESALRAWKLAEQSAREALNKRIDRERQLQRDLNIANKRIQELENPRPRTPRRELEEKGIYNQPPIYETKQPKLPQQPKYTIFEEEDLHDEAEYMRW